MFFVAHFLHVHICPSAYIYTHLISYKEREKDTNVCICRISNVMCRQDVSWVGPSVCVDSGFVLAISSHFGSASMLVLPCGLWHLGALARDINECSFHGSPAKFSGCFQQL